MTGSDDHDPARIAEAQNRRTVVAELTAHQGPFPIGAITVRGAQMRGYLGGPQSLRDVLARAECWSDRPAVTYEDDQWTWSQQADRTRRFASVLVERYGVAKGDRVAIALRNYPEWISAFNAAVGIGAIAVPLNAWWSGEELTHALADCGAGVLVADQERSASVQALRSRAPSLRAVIEVRPGDRIVGDETWDELIAEADPFDLASSLIAPDDDATILYTSGTTGRPNGAVATHRAHLTTLMNLQVHAAVESRLARERGEATPPMPDRPTSLIPGPLFHVSYLPRVIAAPVSGAHFVMMRKWDAARAVDLIEREHVDSFTGVPTVVSQLLDEVQRRGTLPPSLRTVITGGAQTTRALVERIAAVIGPGVRTGTGYGMTETCGAMLMIGSRDFQERPLSVGRPLATSEVRVVDPSGQDVTGDGVGEAWFRSPSVARGYWGRPDDTFAPDGWLRTGDLVRRDADGFVYIVDRIKDIVIRGGENVYCAEVEEVLNDHPDVDDVAVIGVAHDLLGEEVAAVVQTRPTAGLTEDALRTHASRRLAGYKVPSLVVLTSEPLPRNAAGKVLKRDLRDRYGRPSPSAPTSPPTIDPPRTTP